MLTILLLLTLGAHNETQTKVERRGGDTDPKLEKLLDAIEWVESRGDTLAVGDNGRSLGAYQIQRAYVSDALGRRLSSGEYRRISFSRRSSRDAIVRYWKRYAPVAYRQGRAGDLARIHHGGPHGDHKAATKKYWRKVQRVMRDVKK
jgi:hypothetical protein